MLIIPAMQEMEDLSLKLAPSKKVKTLSEK
jgi:hypothetical protein